MDTEASPALRILVELSRLNNDLSCRHCVLDEMPPHVREVIEATARRQELSLNPQIRIVKASYAAAARSFYVVRMPSRTNSKVETTLVVDENGPIGAYVGAAEA